MGSFEGRISSPTARFVTNPDAPSGGGTENAPTQVAQGEIGIKPNPNAQLVQATSGGGSQLEVDSLPKGSPLFKAQDGSDLIIPNKVLGEVPYVPYSEYTANPKLAIAAKNSNYLPYTSHVDGEIRVYFLNTNQVSTLTRSFGFELKRDGKSFALVHNPKSLGENKPLARLAQPWRPAIAQNTDSGASSVQNPPFNAGTSPTELRAWIGTLPRETYTVQLNGISVSFSNTPCLPEKQWREIHRQLNPVTQDALQGKIRASDGKVYFSLNQKWITRIEQSL